LHGVIPPKPTVCKLLDTGQSGRYFTGVEAGTGGFCD
jgi:hypothetical protein